MFDANSVDYAREILIDTKEHDAASVEELVAFMTKYRLQFSNSDRSPSARVLYGQIYEKLRAQASALSIKPEVAAVSSIPLIPAKRASHPADATRFDSKFYKVFDSKLTWHEAKAKCEEMGGRLAEIHGPAKNDFITKLVVKSKLNVVWLGGSDEKKEGRWEWNDGTEITYANWDRANGQPNDAQKLEDYLVLIVDLKGQWWDYPDDANSYPGLTKRGIP